MGRERIERAMEAVRKARHDYEEMMAARDRYEKTLRMAVAELAPGTDPATEDNYQAGFHQGRARVLMHRAESALADELAELASEDAQRPAVAAGSAGAAGSARMHNALLPLPRLSESLPQPGLMGTGMRR